MTAATGTTPDRVAALNRVTPHNRVQWRGDRTTRDGTKMAVLAYMDARYVMDTLDEIVGPENWQDRYEDSTGGGVRCGIGVLVNGEWVWKWDAAPPTDIEKVKGGHSDAMKRAAVKWGIGRDLYDYPDMWVPAESIGNGKYKPAELPVSDGTTWSVPGQSRRPAAAPAASRPAPQASPPAAATAPGKAETLDDLDW